jgi:hypothetical protein
MIKDVLLKKSMLGPTLCGLGKTEHSPETGFKEVNWIGTDKSALSQKSGSGGLTQNMSDARFPVLIVLREKPSFRNI